MLFALLLVAHHDAIGDGLQSEQEKNGYDLENTYEGWHEINHSPHLIFLVRFEVIWVR